MGAIHVFLMFLLVWSVSADEDPISITCEDVIGNVGDKLTLTCRVSYQRDKCCMRLYKFKNTTSEDDTLICKEVFGKGSCLQRASFTCPYTAHAAMTTTFSLFLQTTCGEKTTYFTVNIENADGGNDKKISEESTPVPTEIINSAIICFIIIIIITVGVIILFLRKKHIFTNTGGCQRNYNMGVRTTDEMTTESATDR